MSKPSRKKRLPKKVENLTSDQVMQSIFGKRGAQVLKKEALKEPDDNADDQPIPTDPI